MLNFVLKATRIDKLIFQELETKALAVIRGKRWFDEQDEVWRRSPASVGQIGIAHRTKNKR
jgi:hypothetical protein